MHNFVRSSAFASLARALALTHALTRAGTLPSARAGTLPSAGSTLPDAFVGWSPSKALAIVIALSKSATHTQNTGNSVLKSLALAESPAGFTHPIAPAALFTMSAQPTNELTISTTKTGVVFFLFNPVAQAGISN